MDRDLEPLARRSTRIKPVQRIDERWAQSLDDLLRGGASELSGDLLGDPLREERGHGVADLRLHRDPLADELELIGEGEEPAELGHP